MSSFGADSAVLLHMIAEIDRTLPVIFLDTGKHFEETLGYRDALVADFGLTDMRVDQAGGGGARADRSRRQSAPDRHRRLLRRSARSSRWRAAIAPFRAWLTGRKRFQASTRAALPVFEAVGARIRINPLARWTTADQADYMRAHALRENPLVAYGYLSIGCFPCTQPVSPAKTRAAAVGLDKPRPNAAFTCQGLTLADRRRCSSLGMF